MCQRNQPLRVSSDRQSGRAAWVRSDDIQAGSVNVLGRSVPGTGCCAFQGAFPMVRSGFVGPARGALDVGGAFPGGVEGGVVLEEEAEDDIELANGADSFAEAGL